MGILLTVLVVAAALACFVNPVWALCAYLAVIIIRPNETVEGVKVPAIPIMIITMALAYLLHLGRVQRPQSGPPQRAALLMVLMIILVVLHFFLFPSGRPLLDWILSEAAPTMLLLFYFTRHAATPPRLQAALTTTSASASLISLNALMIHFLGRGPAEEAESADGVLYQGYGEPWNLYHLRGLRLMGKEGSVFGNPNDLGMITNWGIIGCLYYIKRQGSKVLRLAALGVMGLLSASLFLTGSRGGQLQMGINLWMVFVGGKRKALGIFLLVVALAGVLVVLPRLAPERDDADASKNERLELLMAGVRLFKAYPIQGAGFLRFRTENDFKSLYPHNVYVQALSETGLVGGGLFFALILFLRRETKRAQVYFAAREQEDPSAALIAQVIAALQLSYSIFILFSNQFMTFRFGLVMALAMGLYRAMLLHKDSLPPEEAAEDAAGGATTTLEERALPDQEEARGRARRRRELDEVEPRRERGAGDARSLLPPRRRRPPRGAGED